MACELMCEVSSAVITASVESCVVRVADWTLSEGEEIQGNVRTAGN